MVIYLVKLIGEGWSFTWLSYLVKDVTDVTISINIQRMIFDLIFITFRFTPMFLCLKSQYCEIEKFSTESVDEKYSLQVLLMQR